MARIFYNPKAPLERRHVVVSPTQGGTRLLWGTGSSVTTDDEVTKTVAWLEQEGYVELVPVTEVQRARADRAGWIGLAAFIAVLSLSVAGMKPWTFDESGMPAGGFLVCLLAALIVGFSVWVFTMPQESKAKKQEVRP